MFLKATKFFLLINSGLLVVLTILLLWPSSTLAANDPIVLNIPIGATKKVADLGEYLVVFYEYFIGIIGILATVMIMFGGFRWLTAGGSPERIKEGRANIMSAIIAVVLMLCSYLILRLINPALIDMTVPYIEPVKKLEQQSSRCSLRNPPLQVECGTQGKDGCFGDKCPSGKKCVLDWDKQIEMCKNPEQACKSVKAPRSQAVCDPYSNLAIGKVCYYDEKWVDECKYEDVLSCSPDRVRVDCQEPGKKPCWDENENIPAKCNAGGARCTDRIDAPAHAFSICCKKTPGTTGFNPALYTCWGGV